MWLSVPAAPGRLCLGQIAHLPGVTIHLPAGQFAQSDFRPGQIGQHGHELAGFVHGLAQAANRTSCSWQLPWAIFSRKTSTPATIKAFNRSSDSQAGPMVATILVFENRPAGNFCSISSDDKI